MTLKVGDSLKALYLFLLATYAYTLVYFNFNLRSEYTLLLLFMSSSMRLASVHDYGFLFMRFYMSMDLVYD